MIQQVERFSDNAETQVSDAVSETRGATAAQKSATSTISTAVILETNSNRNIVPNLGAV